MRLEVEVRLRRVNDIGINYSTRRAITTVVRWPIPGEESNVVPFPHNDQSDLGADLQVLARACSNTLSTMNDDQKSLRTLKLGQLCNDARNAISRRRRWNDRIKHLYPGLLGIAPQRHHLIESGWSKLDEEQSQNFSPL